MEDYNGYRGEKKMDANKAHVLLFPFPAQGHINPIFQFGKRLTSKGVKTTLAITVYLSKSVHVKSSKVEVETIFDGYDESLAEVESGEEYFARFIGNCSRSLTELVKKYEDTSNPITCLVHDSICPWATDIAKGLGLLSAPFFTQSCNVNSLFYQANRGKLTVPVEEPMDSIPGLPLLKVNDFPTQLYIKEEYPVALELMVGQFNCSDKADWILVNTFNELESEVLKLMAARWRPVLAVGPTAPSMYLDKRVEGDAENSLNFFKPTDSAYIKWLNTKEAGSVVYISFGSLASFEEKQMEELAWGIRQSDKNFLWVVRETERGKLPSNFAEEMSERGLIVAWCSQMQVLAHEAIGCFLTHCGWNSTMEALSLGVPMVAMPHIWDQTTNAKFVQDVWGLGVRVKVDGKGIVGREEVESCIKRVMEGEKAVEIKMNSNKWRELAKIAVDAGGSSDLNVEKFVASITCT